MQVIDFFTSSMFTSSLIYQTPDDTEPRYNNSCRTRILASCEMIHDESDRSEHYYLGKACIGEDMYIGDKIAQIPTYEFCAIYNKSVCKLIKKFADHDNDVVQIKVPGKLDKMFDGTFFDYREIVFDITTGPGRPLTDVQDIIDATVGQEQLVGRTILKDDQTGWRAVLQYPIDYMNVHPPSMKFGVDIGPVIYPDFEVSGDLQISQLEMAYIMYQTFDRVEFAVRCPTAIAGGRGAETLHYSKIVFLNGENQFYKLSKGTHQ